jgi:hypothetical protein
LQGAPFFLQQGRVVAFVQPREKRSGKATRDKKIPACAGRTIRYATYRSVGPRSERVACMKRDTARRCCCENMRAGRLVTSAAGAI